MAFVFHNDWSQVLKDELNQPYYIKLMDFLIQEYHRKLVYPAKEHVFSALQYTSFVDTKIVILGQDPYHGPNQAHGLSFSVKPGVRVPPSLQNIYKELHDDLACPIPQHGYLVSWAKQGVLLLNAVLTVQAGNANSHQGIGWERFTDKIIESLNEREQPLVFILWGKYAERKADFIDTSRHHIISTAHPSPFAARRGFFGSRPFSRANDFLRSAGRGEIQWCVPLNLEGEDV